MPKCVCCCCCCACCFATAVSLPSSQNNGGSDPGSLSPHHRQAEAATYEDDNGTDGMGISFELLMATIDQEHELHLLDEQQQQQGEEGQQLQQQHQEQQQGFSAAARHANPSQPGGKRSVRPSPSAGQTKHRQQHPNQGQEHVGEEEEEEGCGGGGHPTASAAAAAAPVEPSKAVLDGTAVIEAVETAMATTARTAEDTEDALSRLCSRVRNNQVR